MAAAALAVIGCSSDGTDPDKNGNGGGTTVVDKCKAGAGGALGIDFKADFDISAQGQAVKANQTLVVATAGLTAGSSADTLFSVRNVATLISAKELRIDKIELAYAKPDGATDDGAPYECFVKLDGKEVPCKDAGVISVVPDGSAEGFCTTGTRTGVAEIIVRFHKQADNFVRLAVLTLTVANDAEFADGPFRAKLTTKLGTPRLKLSPEVVNFGTVKIGGSEPKKLSILNSGDAPLLVDKLEVALNAPKPIAIKIDDKTYQGGETVILDPPLEIAPQATAVVEVTFTPTGSAGYIDVIKVYSNDADSPHQAKLLGNQNVPCLKIIPAKTVNFGFVSLGTEGVRTLRLESCGSTKVSVTGLVLDKDKDKIFSMDTGSIGALGGKPVDAANPIVIEPNGFAEVQLKCSPEAEFTDSETGKPAPYTAVIGVSDDTIAPDKSVELSCWGTSTNCPTAIIVSLDGEEIVPQGSLTLSADQSFAGPSQQVAKFQWKVTKQPKGAAANHTFYPSASAPVVQFGAKTTNGTGNESITVNIAGEYVFELDVTDDAGNTACVQAVQPVLVVPDKAIHVELLWDTPGDIDKSDSGLGAGADMDLHFTHQSAQLSKLCTTPAEICPDGKACACQQDIDKDGKPDPYFQGLYDCFWYNSAPNWGNKDKSYDDNPSLDLDDTDGWGPENLNLANPENNVRYTVGVHYWDAHDYDKSIANVRIYILGQLKADLFSTALDQCDLWAVKHIDWPSGDLVDVVAGQTNGSITSKYFPNFSKSLGAVCSD